MTSPPISVEDDEDFFDQLVSDEAVNAGSDTRFKGNLDSNGAQECANSTVDEVDSDLDGFDRAHSIEGKAQASGIGGISLDCLDGPHSSGKAEMGDKNDITLCKLDDQVRDMGVEDGGGVKESAEPMDPKIVTEFKDHAEGVESASDSVICGDGANTGGGIKQVQWSAFGGGTGKASYSDFFADIGDNSGDPFRAEAGGFMVASHTATDVSSSQAVCSTTHSFDQRSSQYWENLYPGWRYDPNTGQWHQLDSADTAGSQSAGEGAVTDSRSDFYYFQQTAQSFSGSMSEARRTESLSCWNQTSGGSTQYPAYMVFVPQYPGWYFDTIAQEWKSLDSYFSSINQSVSSDHDQYLSNTGSATGKYYLDQTMTYGHPEEVSNYSHQQGQRVNWNASAVNHRQQGMNMAQPEQFGNSEDISSPENAQFGKAPLSRDQGSYCADNKMGATASDKSTLYEQTSQVFDSGSEFNGFQGFNVVTDSQAYAAPEQFWQHNNQCNMEFDKHFSTSYFNGPKVLNFSQQPLQSSIQSYVSTEGRSSAGRPPHALVAFGFGGKLIFMKDPNILHTQPAYAGQNSAGVIINVLNMMEVTVLKREGADAGFIACDYLCSLCQQSFPSPLVSGNVGAKELHKWIDDRIANCAIQVTDYRKGEAVKMLYSLLKIACQFYGKLRSAFGTDLVLKENDCPESALAKLFASAKGNRLQFHAVNHCLQNMTSERQLQATAHQVQMLLVSGKRMEALQCAQEGQLWGPAIVIAALLGEQFYGETVKQMALHQLVAGSPLRTLCLLLAGQPAEVFSNPIANNPPSLVNFSQPVQVGPSCMLDQWEENLAIITANRTKGDELVITHLGDCLWKERGEVTAAHICYLIAEANIESYSESARLCLVGADHLKCPRTYASPEAIQRTELYEYAKVLGNSQFTLVPLQPYKFIYASMLTEVGKLSDSIKYCQAVLKSLKAGRSPEVDAWRHMLSALEERIKIHQQSGYTTNLAPTKLVGKLLNFFDNTAHRVVGGLPPPIPSPSHGNGRHIEHDHQSRVPQISTSQSTMAISSFMPSASVEGSTRKSLHNRSISEPDIGRTPIKDESPKKSDPSGDSGPLDSSPTVGSSSRLGRFGSQIFQKTLGLVLRSRPDRQAKLGEKNKFYYDEKLKRWVEEDAEPPAEEPALAPPPTAAAFMNGVSDHDKKDESNSTIHANGQAEFKSADSFEKKAGTPPLPSGVNQFSARGRMGVRARYVDTFNRGGGTQPNLFQSPSPSVPKSKPAIGNAKFFIPTPVTPQETDTFQGAQEAVLTDEDTTTSNQNHSFSSPEMLTPPPTPPAAMPRYTSMEELANKGTMGMMNGNGSIPSMSRRPSSWSGRLGDMGTCESIPPGEAPGSLPSSIAVIGNSPSMPFSSDSATLSEGLQDVQL